MMKDKVAQLSKSLLDTLWSDDFWNISSWARRKSGYTTKNISAQDVEYILEGLEYRGHFNKDWAGREEMTRRFIEVLVQRGETMLLLDAAYGALSKYSKSLCPKEEAV